MNGEARFLLKSLETTLGLVNKKADDSRRRQHAVGGRETMRLRLAKAEKQAWCADWPIGRAQAVGFWMIDPGA